MSFQRLIIPEMVHEKLEANETWEFYSLSVQKEAEEGHLQN